MMTKETALKQYFGYDSFRPLQAEVIDDILAGKDGLAVMPAGGGKSLCCHLASLLQTGISVIISPLVQALKERVQALQAIGIAAEGIHSAQPFEEQRAIEEDCREGRIKILYISLEKFFAGNYYRFLKELPLHLLVIEEAHGISVWGHDYRAECLQLKILKTEFPQIPLWALSSVADKTTRQDILKQLGIEQASLWVAPFHHPQTRLSVLPGRRRLDAIRDFLEKRPNQAGIIYCLSRKTTEYIAQSLQEMGFKAKHFHAGLDTAARVQAQEEFLRGSLQIIVATIAFGTGLDKPNIRWMVHYNMPRNIESFYHEISRIGRDGLPADSLILYSYADVIAQMRFNEELPQERKDLLNMKLELMRAYSETTLCRRRVILAYFDQYTAQDCGNCDGCEGHGAHEEATIIAQKILSCVARTNELIPQNLLIDILRGEQSKEVMLKGYDRLKTFGVGADFSQEEWAFYTMQLIAVGYLDIAYQDQYRLKLNERSWGVLKEGKTVVLSKFVGGEKDGEQLDNAPKPKHEVIQDELFERLKGLRKQIADREGTLSQNILSDTTLWEMAQYKPIREHELEQITGITPEKVRRYGYDFTEGILAFIREKKTQASPPKQPKNAYHKPFQAHYQQETEQVQSFLQMYQSGLRPQQIADKRGVKLEAVISQLIKSHQEDQAEIDFWQLISRDDYEIIMDAVGSLQMKKGDVLKPLYEYLNEEFEYYKLRVALLLWEQEQAKREEEARENKAKINQY